MKWRALILLLAFAGPAYAPAYAYDMTLNVVGDKAAEAAVEQHSKLWAEKGKGPVPAHQLRYRLQQDQTHLENMLGALGYYGADVSGEIKTDSVALQITTGSLFQLGAPKIEWLGGGERPALPDLAALGFIKGASAVSETVLAAKDAVGAAMADEGFHDAVFACENLVVDHTTNQLNVHWCLQPGPRHVLTQVEVVGLEKVKPDYVNRLAQQDEGAPVTPHMRAKVAQELTSAGLFESVSVRQETQSSNGQAHTKVIADVVERPHRTLSAGVRYNTSEGAGISLGWQHRNLFGRAERLAAEIKLAQEEQSAGLTFAKPDFYHRQRTLRLGTKYKVETTDAYEIETIGVSADIDQKISKAWSATIGAALDTTLEQLPGGDQRFSLGTLRAGAVYDVRNSVLNPTKGFRVAASLAPAFGVIDTTGQFLTSRLSGSIYFPIGTENPHVIALRAAVASITGGSLINIPSDRLLYAGGGGSVRGFAYQSVGPVDGLGAPAGGRSLAEGAIELRSPITENIGLVVFADTGLVGPARLPQTDDRMEVGAGLGVRYKTPAGPLRLDVGFPVTRRPTDDPFQVYISIGQAF